MRRVKYTGGNFITFTFEEEMDMARFVMDLISELWVREGFQRILDKIYDKKLGAGLWLTQDDYDELGYYLSRPLYESKIASAELQWPSLIDNGDDIGKDLMHLKKGKKAVEERRLTRLAWVDAWQSHPRIKAVAGKYERLPSNNIEDDSEEIEKKNREYEECKEFLEDRLAAAIEKALVDNPEFSHPDAYLFVKDFCSVDPENYGFTRPRASSL